MPTKLWDRAGEMADATPASRNRYVDLLRAVSILAVVLGHWLIAAPVVTEGTVRGINLLGAQPWTQYLTWAFQVMPLFFFVGGYSNRVSWQAAARDDRGYGAWLGDRLRRLVLPAVPLIVIWSVFAPLARAFGVDGDLIRLGSQAALIPLWFLAVYVLIIALVPLSIAAWDRFGLGSVVALGVAAVVVDAVRFESGFEMIGWVNFVFVWAAIHQLGYAWRDGRLGSGWQPLAWGLAALGVLFGLVTIGTYPLSMVGVPGAIATNNSPPTVALLALGFAQAGFALAIEPLVTRWLGQRSVWTATIMINGSIMTLYLWHLTAMVAVIGVSLLLGGVGLGIALGSFAWWVSRPVWVVILAMATVPFLVWFGRFERPGKGEPLGAGRALAAAILACVGFALIAGGGIASAGSWLEVEAVVPVLAAGWLLRVGGHRRAGSVGASADLRQVDHPGRA